MGVVPHRGNWFVSMAQEVLGQGASQRWSATIRRRFRAARTLWTRRTVGEEILVEYAHAHGAAKHGGEGKADVLHRRFDRRDAEVMGISPATVCREWTAARAWLHGERSSYKPG